LLPYKNVECVIAAFRALPNEQLVVVGRGPAADALAAMAPTNVTFLDGISDAQLRWVYAHSYGNVSASYEDYGLTPLEAASFGKPSVALRWGGFLDTVLDGETGIFFDAPRPDAVASAIAVARDHPWEEDVLMAHSDAYSEEAFVARLREIVDQVGGRP
jgi:glycosyltransferase involved in cell wall biosynthesis